MQEKEAVTIKTVFTIPAIEKKKDSVDVCLSFPSSTFACVSDGSSKLYLLTTDDRTTTGSDKWKVAHAYELDQPFIILHSTENKDSGTIGCLLLSIVENEEAETVRDSHIVILDLAMFSQAVASSGVSSFTCDKIREFRGNTTPVYAAIEPGSKGILVASERSFYLVGGIF